MKALTVYQPWASLIVTGAKPYEFRKWSAPRSIIGQRIVIHAASRDVVRNEACGIFHAIRARHSDAESALATAQTCLVPRKALPILRRAWSPHQAPLPLSAGIGTAVLGEPRPAAEIAAEFGVEHVNDSDRDGEALFGWPMLDVELWDAPIPARGNQGFWNWPTPADVLGEGA